MSRSVAEWIGATDDTAVPARVRARVFERDGGKCIICTRKIASGERWICDHVKALINGGANRESNLGTICGWCDAKVKTPADVAEKRVVARKKAKHLGIKKQGRKLPGGRDSPWKIKIGGGAVRRDGE